MCPQATGSRFSAARKKMFMEPRKTRNTKTHSRIKAFSSCLTFFFLFTTLHILIIIPSVQNIGSRFPQP